MSGIDIFAWIVLVVIVASVLVVFAVLGMLPGNVARKREHPQAEAINVASWLALICGLAAWPFVLVWAYLRPVARPLDQPEGEAARQRIAKLEARIAELESAPEGGEVQ